MNRIEVIPPETYDLIAGLLNNGKIEKGGKLIDFSPVQTITISNGKISFHPPAKISAKLGMLRINTTITEIRKTGTGIKVDIDNSPIDVELRKE